MPPSSSTLYPWKPFGSINNVLLILLLSLVSISDNVNGASDDGIVIDSEFLTNRIDANHTITVDVNGDGDFKSVQAAIDSVPEGNSNWVLIDIRRGIYREKVHIPSNKPNIFMRGSGRGKTSIVWSQVSVNNRQSATFISEANDFVASGISFKNEAPIWLAHAGSHNQSVAAFVGGNKSAFYDCAFFSPHNTLFDYQGIHYYHNCYIQGAIDLIFGRAQSIFDNCEILVVGGSGTGDVHGSITAHSRKSAGENSGFVFVNGRIYGAGSDINVYLGRAKEAFSRVIFANTYLSKSIVPQGWTNWRYEGSTENVHHAEYNCHGPGAADPVDPKGSGRAPWSKQLKHEEAAPFLSIDYIRGKDWLPAWL